MTTKKTTKKEEKTEKQDTKTVVKKESTKKKKATGKKSSKKRKSVKKSSAIVARGKRKQAVARATINKGSGTVRINGVSLTAYNNKYITEMINQPIRYVTEAASVDISVNVFGGGIMGQAQAARTAIANALVKYFPDLKLKEKFIEIDRSLIVEDTRRVEAKKYKGPKARARYQKSYR